MRTGTKTGRVGVGIATAALVASAVPGAVAAQDPVAVCELAYYTGEFGAYGESLTNDVVVPVENVINLDPPMGRPWELYHEDLGTNGEAQAARACLEQHGAEVVVSIAHGYRTYRDWLQEYIEENDAPIGPSVHGGSIPGNLGGTATEPIFRAQGLDEALGHGGVLQAKNFGAEDVVIFATNVEGFQLAANGAEFGAPVAGLELLARIDVPPEQPSYRAEAQRIADLDPDAVIVQAGSVESATLIKQALEAGYTGHWIGETGWIQNEFIDTLGTEPIAANDSIGFAAFGPDTESPAWEFYSNMWNESTDTEKFGGPEDQYHFSTYDLLVQTALAAEAAQSYKASEWVPAMRAVGEAPGEVCYTYADCLALIRDGQDIDYEGVTGPGVYSEGGVNTIRAAYTPFLEDGSAGEAELLDVDELIALLPGTTQAECEDNICEW
jgi:hypothetical protein